MSFYWTNLRPILSTLLLEGTKWYSTWMTIFIIRVLNLNVTLKVFRF